MCIRDSSLIEDSILWSYINKIVKKRLETYNFEEIITPSIENIDTFKNGMGGDTDIVSKEMYEFMLFKDCEIKDKTKYYFRDIKMHMNNPGLACKEKNNN